MYIYIHELGCGTSRAAWTLRIRTPILGIQFLVMRLGHTAPGAVRTLRLRIMFLGVFSPLWLG